MEMIGNSRQRARVSSLAKQWLELGKELDVPDELCGEAR